MQILPSNGWIVNPLITITARIRGAIHEPLMQALKTLSILSHEIYFRKQLMKYIHHISINVFGINKPPWTHHKATTPWHPKVICKGAHLPKGRKLTPPWSLVKHDQGKDWWVPIHVSVQNIDITSFAFFPFSIFLKNKHSKDMCCDESRVCNQIWSIIIGSIANAIEKVQVISKNQKTYKFILKYN